MSQNFDLTPGHLPAGATPPTDAALRAFFEAAVRACPEIGPRPVCEIRWIGLDAESTLQILELIRARDKTGTFTLPWIVERTGQPVPRVGALLVLIDMGGRPTLMVRTRAVLSLYPRCHMSWSNAHKSLRRNLRQIAVPLRIEARPDRS